MYFENRCREWAPPAKRLAREGDVDGRALWWKQGLKIRGELMSLLARSTVGVSDVRVKNAFR